MKAYPKSRFGRAFLWGCFAIVLCGLVVACSPRQAETGEEEVSATSADPIERGGLAYATYCAACHGTTGLGDGPVAEALETPPTNLTLLQQQNNGTYPTDRVFSYIDGRESVAAHGTREMPVWGNIWEEEGGRPVSREEVDRRINELVEYIRTLQVTAEASTP